MFYICVNGICSTVVAVTGSSSADNLATRYSETGATPMMQEQGNLGSIIGAASGGATLLIIIIVIIAAVVCLRRRNPTKYVTNKTHSLPILDLMLNFGKVYFYIIDSNRCGD